MSLGNFNYCNILLGSFSEPSVSYAPLLHFYTFLLENSLIEDRGKTDRVTALPRPSALDMDIWLWPMTLTYNPTRAKVMTHIDTQTLVHRSVGSKDRVETNGRTDRLTNRRSLSIALASRLTRSVNVYRDHETVWPPMCRMFTPIFSPNPICRFSVPTFHICHSYRPPKKIKGNSVWHIWAQVIAHYNSLQFE